MGLYDTVGYYFSCPKCGHDMWEFQTKDGHVEGEGWVLPSLSGFQPWEVERFYGICDGCRTFYEFENKRIIPKKVPSDWESYIFPVKRE